MSYPLKQFMGKPVLDISQDTLSALQEGEKKGADWPWERESWTHVGQQDAPEKEPASDQHHCSKHWLNLKDTRLILNKKV